MLGSSPSDVAYVVTCSTEATTQQQATLVKDFEEDTSIRADHIALALPCLSASEVAVFQVEVLLAIQHGESKVKSVSDSASVEVE